MAKRVLIVDDDEGIIDAITLILQDAGYAVDSIYDADHVYDKVQLFKPDAILLDVLMSGHDGRDICMKLKANDDTKNISIIMISAHPTAKEGAIKAGANAFLAKPFELDQLLSMVSRFTA